MVKLIRYTDSQLAKVAPPSTHSRSKSKSISIPGFPGLRLEVSKAGTRTWYLSITRNGTKRTTRLGIFPSLCLNDACKLAQKLRHEIEQDRIPQGLNPRAKISFGDFATNYYLPYAVQTKRSAGDDESKCRLHLYPRFGSIPLEELNRRDIECYVAEMCSSHCASTANRHLSLITRMLTKAVEWEYLEVNVARGIKKFREDNAPKAYLKPDELRRLLDAMEHEPNKIACLALKFLLFTGLRRSEALHATWAQIDFASKTLYLSQTKGGRSRHVILNDAAWDIIELLNMRRESNFIFPGKTPDRHYDNLQKPMHRLLCRAGLPHFRVHDLRHAYASLLVSQGAPLYQVQQLLGHASPLMTQRYSHLADDTLRETSQIVGRILLQANAHAHQ